MVNGYPKSLNEALELRAEGYRPIGGGTDLMVRYRSRSGLLPTFDAPLLFLREVEGLDKLEEREGKLHIGATVTLKCLTESPLTPEPFKGIIMNMASYGVRSEATLAGNLGNASPAADSLPFLYCRDSSVVLVGMRGERTLPLADFIMGPGKTALGDDEIIKEIILPLEEAQISFHKKVGGRKSDAISKLSFYGEAVKEGDEIIDLKIAFGSVAPRIVRIREAEELLLKALNGGKSPEEAIGLYDAAIRPIDDQRSTADYRKQVSLNLLNRFLEMLG